jgi:hypothetical protein
MSTLLKWTLGCAMWFDWFVEAPQRHCQHKVGIIRGHAYYRGKPMIAIWLNALFQMSYRLQRTWKWKKTWKHEDLIVCTCYKGNYWTMHTFSIIGITKKSYIFYRMSLNVVEINERMTIVGNIWSRSCYLSNQEGGTWIALGDARCWKLWPN